MGTTNTATTSASGTGTTSTTGATACDHDADGHEAPSCGGDDCDDEDPTVFPGAPDTNVGTGPWVAERILENIPGDVRGQPSIAIEEGGAIHVTHGEAGLRHVTNRTGTWVEQMIDPDADGPTSMKVDARGVIHVSYISPAGLRHATDAGGDWVVATIDEAASGASSLALDGLGTPHLLYAASGAAHLLRLDPDGWTSLIAVDGGAGAPSLAVAADGSVHATFSAVTGSDSGVWYMKSPDAAGDWSVELVAPGSPVVSTSLALDPAGSAHIAFSFAKDGANGLRHATNESGAWTTELVDDSDVVWSASLAASPTQTGLLHIGYESFDVAHAVRSGGVWSLSTASPPGHGVSLALDPDGAVHLAHSGFSFTVETFVNHVTNRAVVPDGVDQSCDGVDGVDADHDGHAGAATGGADCDDQQPEIHPGAPDQEADGIDQDCDGADGAG